ncbi:MAG TPA: NAD-dependent succinate-semialdehyde dehydrogenase, partial [Solirubrobacteraceae bacterium]|nr:NAD-dependent succinate-semialdehyde dehydrogenase [Solirubrobacteraceae bacterium]
DADVAAGALMAGEKPAPKEHAVLASVPKQLFIAGEWRDATGAGTLAVEDPSTGETLVEVADAQPGDTKAALAAAADAQGEWAVHAPRERGEILRRAYEAIVERSDELALLMTLEMGKSLSESRAEISYAAEFFRWFSEEAVRIHGRYMVNTTGKGRILTMRQPVGPCVFVTPWNFPTAMGTRKIAPAIAAGCTMVVKPAQQTPLSMLALAQILEQAGLPRGVLNVITASKSGEVIEPLLKDERARKLSFTGSTEVGRRLIEQSAEQILRVSMELGGNAPFLVFADADLDAAIDGAMLAKMRNVGEACTAANRFHVHESIAGEFAERLAARMRELKVGRGTEPDVDVGPLIDEAQQTKVAELVDDAAGRGARVLLGGERVGERGYFYAPTVLADVPDDARLLAEEIFDPVAPVATFASDEQAIAAANRTEYGLVAYVYTRDLDRAFRVSEAIETGMVGLNQGVVSNPAAPFGGVKQSGFGREGGFEGIGEYLETKYVALATLEPLAEQRVRQRLDLAGALDDLLELPVACVFVHVSLGRDDHCERRRLVDLDVYAGLAREHRDALDRLRPAVQRSAAEIERPAPGAVHLDDRRDRDLRMFGHPTEVRCDALVELFVPAVNLRRGRQ